MCNWTVQTKQSNQVCKLPYTRRVETRFLLQLEPFMLETDCAASWAELGLLSSLFPLRPLHFLFFSHFFCSTEWPWLTITNHPPRCPPPLPLPASEITQGPLSLPPAPLFLFCSVLCSQRWPSPAYKHIDWRLASCLALTSSYLFFPFLSFNVSFFKHKNES